MHRSLLIALAALACCLSFGQRPDDLIKQIDGMQRPKWDSSKQGDEAYMRQYSKLIAAYTKQRNDLILQLYKAAPKEPRTIELMKLRWREFQAGNINGDQFRKDLFKDVDEVLASGPPDEIKEAGLFAKAIEILESGLPDLDPTPSIDDFIKAFPKSDKGPQLLLTGATMRTTASHRTEYLKRLVSDFPDSQYAPMAKGALRQEDAIGKPFSFKFNDAVSGAPVDTASYKGKVVLVDFWATWCGPCVSAMPHLQELATKNNGALQVVGVSLDYPEKQGGLEKLKAFVAKNSVPWPQYYLGKGWDSEFSQSWGIMMIPCVFLIDKDGNLADVNPENLEGRIERLIQK